MKKTGYLLFLILPLCFVAGCIQGQAAISLNPDGSGKIAFEGLYDSSSHRGDSSDIAGDFKAFIEKVKKTLTTCRGIDGWRDVNWRVMKDGRFYIRAQAYFNDINNMDIYMGDIKSSFKVVYQRNKKQQNALELNAVKIIPDDMSVDHQSLYSIQRYENFCSIAEQILKQLQLVIIINLPTDISKLEGFEKIDPRTAQYSLNGSRIVPLLQSICKQGEYDSAAGWNYDPVQFLNNELLPEWMNGRPPLRMYFADSNESTFDYGREVSDAQKEYSGILEKLESAETIHKPTHLPQKAGDALKINIDINDINGQFRNGLLLEAESNYPQAAQIYSAITADNQIDSRYLAQAYYRLGMCLFEMGDPNKAVEHFEYVLANFPSQRTASLRSLKMIQDIRSGIAKRKADVKQDKPAIIASNPEIYTDDVNSAIDKITIKFSEPMEASQWFYSSFSPGMLPQVTAEPYFDPSGLQWTLPVKLKPSEVYAIAFNCGDAVGDEKSFKAGFRSQSGEKCRPFVLVFATMDEDNVPTEISEDFIIKADEINSKSEK